MDDVRQGGSVTRSEDNRTGTATGIRMEVGTRNGSWGIKEGVKRQGAQSRDVGPGASIRGRDGTNKMVGREREDRME